MDCPRLVRQSEKLASDLARDHSVGAPSGSLTDVKETQKNAL